MTCSASTPASSATFARSSKHDLENRCGRWLAEFLCHFVVWLVVWKGSCHNAWGPENAGGSGASCVIGGLQADVLRPGAAVFEEGLSSRSVERLPWRDAWGGVGGLAAFTGAGVVQAGRGARAWGRRAPGSLEASASARPESRVRPRMAAGDKAPPRRCLHPVRPCRS